MYVLLESTRAEIEVEVEVQEIVGVKIGAGVLLPSIEALISSSLLIGGTLLQRLNQRLW